MAIIKAFFTRWQSRESDVFLVVPVRIGVMCTLLRLRFKNLMIIGVAQSIVGTVTSYVLSYYIGE